MSVRFIAELARDGFGLLGAGISTLAFFRFERRKKEAYVTQGDVTPDPDLKRELLLAQRNLSKRVLRPNDLDIWWTAIGLLLIAMSFLISIGLTIAEHLQS